MSLIHFVILVVSISIDCPNVIDLARGLGIQISQTAIWNLLQSDCCDAATGLTCTGDRVTVINWSFKLLNGFINGTAIPSGLLTLMLNSNQIIGSIPSLPSNLTKLWLHNNNMGGDVPTLPDSLIDLNIGFNQFTGTVRLNNKPTKLNIENNWITDVIIQDVTGMNSLNCKISNNPLLGNPNILNLVSCVQISLYAASLLPNTQSITTVRSMTSQHMSSWYPSLVTTSQSTTAISSFNTPTPGISTTRFITTDVIDAGTNSNQLAYPSSTQLISSDPVSSQISQSRILNLDVTTLNEIANLTLGEILANTLSISVLATSSVAADPLSDTPNVIPNLVYISIALGVFVVICIVVLIAKYVVKDPRIKNGKFQRKHSDGTLYTLASKKEGK